MLKKGWKLGHVGLFVNDWNIPMGYYQTKGIGVTVGPQVFNMDYQEGEPSKVYVNNKVPRLNGGSGPEENLEMEYKPVDFRRPGTYKFLDKNLQVGHPPTKSHNILCSSHPSCVERVLKSLLCYFP